MPDLHADEWLHSLVGAVSQISLGVEGEICSRRMKSAAHDRTMCPSTPDVSLILKFRDESCARSQEIATNTRKFYHRFE
jgi:hypothetical protein